MRQLLLFSSVFLMVCGADAQQITNVTVTPNPLHACEQATYNVSGIVPPGGNVNFIGNTVTADSVTLVVQMDGPSSGSSAFSQSLGPFGPYAEGTYVLTISLQYNGTITDTWNGTLNVIAPIIPSVGDPTTTSVCENSAPFTLLSALDGNPDPGGIWLDPLNNEVPDGMFTPGVSLAGDYLYYFVLSSPCTPVYQTLTINYAPNNSAGTDSTAMLCSLAGLPSVNLFLLLGGDPDAGGTWTGPGGVDHGPSFVPGVDQTGEYGYHVAGIDPCPGVSSTVTITAVPPANAGDDSSVILCYDDDYEVLNDYLVGEDNTGLWYNPTGAVETSYDQPLDIATDGEGTYMYVVMAPPCPADTSLVVVTFDGPPCTVGITATEEGTNGFTLRPNPASDRVTITLGDHQAGGQVLELSDLNGRVLRQELLGNTGANRSFVMDISSLAQGAYVVRTISAEGTAVRKLLVR